MKNLIKIITLVLILILTSVLNVYASTNNPSISITADKTELKIGDVVTINLNASSENGIEGIDSTLEYDKTKLELTNSNAFVNKGFSNMSGEDSATGEFKLTVISDSTNTITEANYATLKFKVLDAADVDETLTIKLTKIELGDSNDEWTDIADKEVVLKVIEDTTENEDNPPADDGKPDDEENPPADDGKPDNEDKNPTDDDKKPGNQKPADKDNTQADKNHEHAGLEDYTFAIIVVVALTAYVSYIKYKQYRNI